MASRKVKQESAVPEPRSFLQLKKVILIDDGETGFFIARSLIHNVANAETIEWESNAMKVLENLQKVKRLDDVPELIFLDLEEEKDRGWGFLDGFRELSDFVRKKCKLVVIGGENTEKERTRIMETPGVLRFLVKPLDAYQFKDII